MDVIFGIIFAVVFLIFELTANIMAKRLESPFLQKYAALGQSVASKIVVAFLAGFCVFVIFTDRVPNAGQKIPIIIAAGLLIWVNMFLSQHPEQEKPEKEQEEN